MSNGRRIFLKSSAAFTAAAALAPASVFSLGESIPYKTLISIADKVVADKATAGIQIAAWRSGQPVFSLCRGYANLETRSIVSPSSVFRIGSLTKQFTAAMIARLSELGKISLADNANKYLGVFDKQEPFTIEELVHHTAGIHDDQESPPLSGQPSQMDLARAISRQARLFDFEPGTAWLYSNANYIVLGAVIEAVTGLTLDLAAQQLLFTPLKMARTAFDRQSDIVPERVSGYSYSDTSPPYFTNAEPMQVEQAGAAGAMRSTASDLCGWHQSLLSDRLFSKSSLDRILAPARLRDGRAATANRFDPKDSVMGETGYGFGLLLDHSTTDGSLIIHHNGFISGFSSYLATHVPSKLSIACLCNADPNPGLPFRDIRKSFFARYLAPST